MHFGPSEFVRALNQFLINLSSWFWLFWLLEISDICFLNGAEMLITDVLGVEK